MQSHGGVNLVRIRTVVTTRASRDDARHELPTGLMQYVLSKCTLEVARVPCATCHKRETEDARITVGRDLPHQYCAWSWKQGDHDIACSLARTPAVFVTVLLILIGRSPQPQTGISSSCWQMLTGAAARDTHCANGRRALAKGYKIVSPDVGLSPFNIQD